jgi:hypothetical protein
MDWQELLIGVAAVGLVIVVVALLRDVIFQEDIMT